MRRLLLAVLTLGTVISAGWWGTARTIENVVMAWLEDRVEEGWLVEYDTFGVDGYPTDFRIGFENLALADPETGYVWRLPALELKSRVLHADHVTATWPATQSLTSSRDSVTINAANMTSELDVRSTEGFALDLSDTVLRDVAVQSDAGWTLTLLEGRLTMQRQEGQEATYDVTFVARNLQLPQPTQERLDPSGLLPDAIATLDYQASMQFDRPWDIRAVEDRRPQIVRLDLDELNAVWGGLVLRSAGSLDVDSDGLPDGALALRAENWRDMVALAVRGGLIPEQMGGTVEGLLDVVAGLSGEPDVIDATLDFSNGWVFLGPLPLGAAPRFVLQ